MAVLTAPQQVPATVGYIGNGKPSKFGDGHYYSVCFEAPSLPEKTIWKNLQREEIEQLRKGMQVTLQPTNRNGKDTYDVILNAPPAEPIANPKPGKPEPTIAKEQKFEIAQYISDMGDLYAFCYAQALEKLPDAPEAAKQAMASSLFIASQRRFNLA